MAIELRVPEVGESVKEVQIGAWRISVGERVELDQPVVSIETDKVTVDVLAPSAGVLAQILLTTGSAAVVGDIVGILETGASLSAVNADVNPGGTIGTPLPTSPGNVREVAGLASGRAEPAAPPAALATPWVSPSARRSLAVKDAPKVSAIIREGSPSATATNLAPSLTALVPNLTPNDSHDEAAVEEETIPMSPFRLKASERLLQAQQNAALLTTFNEIDMSVVQQIRKDIQSQFQEKHGVKLGLMSFFVRAVVEALRAIPVVNAEVRANNIVYKNHYDIGIAVGGGRGLIVPVLRNAERMGFAAIEKAIADYGSRARDNKIALHELTGGTFTISNGGVYGSMLSTPIVNPPQSAILGLHAITDRPVARDGQVVIRPMMYVALTYDHRIIDGREAVTFLRKVKDYVEQPTKILFEV